MPATRYLPVVRLFRSREPGADRVAFIELFFDLVFVFAVTQLSHHLIEHVTFRGALETLVMLVAVWWVWIYTTWVTNWMNPEKGPVRWMLIALMLAGLVLSTPSRTRSTTGVCSSPSRTSSCRWAALSSS